MVKRIVSMCAKNVVSLCPGEFSGTSKARRCFTTFTESPPIDYNLFLTKLSKSRRPSAVREMVPFLRVPGMISLAAGTPNPVAFPFRALTFNVPINPVNFDVSNESDMHEISLTPEELEMALQYSPSNGIAPFVDILKKWHFNEHKPPYASGPNDDNFDLVVSTGTCAFFL